MTNQTLRECPFCDGPVQFRKALWPSDGNTDAVIHCGPSDDCGLVDFDIGTTDERVIAAWNRRAAAPAGGGDEHRANVACEIGACPMFQCRCSAAVIVAIKSRAAAAEERADKLQATVVALVEALELLMQWMGPPPCDRESFDSLREDGWKKARAALAAFKGNT